MFTTLKKFITLNILLLPFVYLKKLHQEEFIAFLFYLDFFYLDLSLWIYIHWSPKENIRSNLGARVTGVGKLPKWMLQGVKRWSTSRTAGVLCSELSLKLLIGNL